MNLSRAALKNLWTKSGKRYGKMTKRKMKRQNTKHYRASTAPESDLHKPLSCCFHSVHYRASTAPESNTPQATLMLLSLSTDICDTTNVYKYGTVWILKIARYWIGYVLMLFKASSERRRRLYTLCPESMHSTILPYMDTFSSRRWDSICHNEIEWCQKSHFHIHLLLWMIPLAWRDGNSNCYRQYIYIMKERETTYQAYITYYILPIDCLFIVYWLPFNDAHMFNHNGYGPDTKAHSPRPKVRATVMQECRELPLWHSLARSIQSWVILLS